MNKSNETLRPCPPIRRQDVEPPTAMTRQLAYLRRCGIRPEIAGVVAGLAFSNGEARNG